MTNSGKLTEILDDVAAAATARPYLAYNGLWLALVRLANMLPTVGGEHAQIVALVQRLSREEASRVLADGGVDRLLNLEPPLETVLADPRERLNADGAAKEMGRLKARRSSDPKTAILALVELMQRIRNKREHAFKSPHGSRDAEILQAAGSILRCLCTTLGAHLAPQVLDGESLSHGA